MYIIVTIDLKHYGNDSFDLRLSNYNSVKKLIDIVWQAKAISEPPREGYWVRIPNKQIVLSGTDKLVEHGITTGDRFEILSNGQ
ncbi:EsaB/YukD family protein [Peribacillus sp. JNUCC 23]